MQLPSSLYRLQFRAGMDFARAERLVPYLDRLGVGALYASPLFTAQTGSTHGYDVVRQDEVDPALGGREGLESLSAALRERGMGLVLDIVPNHMAFTVENLWLRDVLRHGEGSRYHGHFDWLAPGRIRLPWLPAPFAEIAEEFRVEDGADGPELVRGGLRVPLAPGTETLPVEEMHEAQPWQLAFWRTEADAITHRRFFNVTSLIGVPVEKPEVFDDVHALTLDLVREGTVTGIRIDHVDGLADPGAYLQKLRNAVGLDVPIWVEKILTGSEEPPADWPIEGTTGYVAARAIGQVLTDPEGHAAITDDWRAFTGREESFAEALDAAKRQIVRNDLSAELWQLQHFADELMQGSEHGPEAIRQALISYVVAFPRYRTYGQADADVIRETAAKASEDAPAAADLGEALLRPEGADMLARLQQVTGAAIAKAQEDTAFYRWSPLLSANEVGAEPDEPTADVEGFHAFMQRRVEIMPRAITLTSSHDTKRSEDSRARLIAATHAVPAWRAFLEDAPDPGGLVPDAAWHGLQSALALPPGETDRADRLSDHLVKAMREAKMVTFHADPSEEAEAPVPLYAAALAAMPEAPEPLPRLAVRLSLIQAALKLTVPGLPDIYQGCEALHYGLTDPDNRRAPDWDRLSDLLARADDFEGGADDPDLAKMAMTAALLRLRREMPDAFLEDYRPIDAPEGVIAFSRGDRIHVAVAIRPPAAAPVLPGSVVWGDAALTAVPVAVSRTT